MAAGCTPLYDLRLSGYNRVPLDAYIISNPEMYFALQELALVVKRETQST